MQKIILLTFFIFALSVGVFGQTKAVIIKTSVNCFAKADANSKVITTLKKGRNVKLNSAKHFNGWYSVSIGNIKGWVNGNDIEFVDDLPDLSAYAIKPKKDNWIYYSTGSVGKFYYNEAKTIRSGSTVIVWVKQLSEKTYESLSMFRYEIKCGSERYRALAGTKYSSDGSAYNTLNRPDSSYSTVIPETVMDSLYNSVCKL